jgi:predicted glutamine amidotransferase
MCHFLAVKIGKESDRPTLQKLINYNLEELSTQRSGYSVYNGSTANYTSEEDYTTTKLKRNNRIGGADVFITHFRTATAGDKGVGGLHLSDAGGGWIFAHNGIVSNYQGVTDKSDSFYFFRKLLKLNPELSFDGIVEIAQEKGFYGRAVLYNPETKNLVLIAGTSEIYITAVKNSLIFSTFKIARSEKTWNKYNVLGLTWYKSSQSGKIIIKHREKKTNWLARFDGRALTDERDVKLSREIATYTWAGKAGGLYE